MHTKIRKGKYIIDSDTVNGFTWTDIINTETGEIDSVQRELYS